MISIDDYDDRELDRTIARIINKENIKIMIMSRNETKMNYKFFLIDSIEFEVFT